MTAAGQGVVKDAVAVLTAVAAPHQESPTVARRRRVIVSVVLVIGAALLGFTLTREPGDASFYWLTFGLAAVWAIGALASGPLHLGFIRWHGRNRRPVITGTAVGLLLGAVFIVGGLIAREIPFVDGLISQVLAFAGQGTVPLVVVITLVNGVAEEMFFRGALYSALGHRPVLISTALYVVATLASGNLMLGFAAIILGSVCAYERRATGGIVAPILTHLVWGLIMVLALPPLFGE
jgi:membrane protease YdiL (CAAX protease family)